MPTIQTLAGPIDFSYTAQELTQAIDVLPNLYGRLNEMNLFPGKGVSTTLVRVSFRNGQVTVLAAEERGSNGSAAKVADENAIYLEIPHIPHMDYIKPDDLQDMLAFNQNPIRMKTFEDAMNERLQAIKNKHSITREYLRMGALKGKIIDGAGNELHDLFERFDIEKVTVDFALDNPATDVIGKTREVARAMETNLQGEVMTSVHALVSPEFFDALTSHPNVEKFYVNWQSANVLAGDPRKMFPFGSMVFEEYNASATLMNGTSGRFIDEGYAHAYPMGTMNTFATYDGPAHDLNMVNMPGAEIYVSPKVLDHGAGIELKSQSNPLPVCARPALLRELVMS